MIVCLDVVYIQKANCPRAALSIISLPQRLLNATNAKLQTINR